MSPPPPPTFTTRKTTILTSLSFPPTIYTDASPKGTVDAAIRHLIDRINTLEGCVTTSSCAGRVSVFLEGKRRHGNGNRSRDDDGLGEERGVPGGKGIGGRWLFVSHAPLEKNGGYTARDFGLREPRKGSLASTDPHRLRVARFQFEPMILHIMTASLHHAQPILAAAINAGFRESGVQSLKNLDDGNAFPMVAVRSAGLALESVVGVLHDQVDDESEGGKDSDASRGASNREALDDEQGSEDEETAYSVVSEEYLEMLRKLANERFKANSERMRRFEEELFRRQGGQGSEWEDGEVRKERKRADGLRMQGVLRREAEAQHSNVDGDDDVGNGMLFGSVSMS